METLNFILYLWRDVLEDFTLLGKCTVGPILVVLVYAAFFAMAPLMLLGCGVAKLHDKVIHRWPVLGTQIRVAQLFIKQTSMWRYQ